MTRTFNPDTVSYPTWQIAEQFTVTDPHEREVLFFWAACMVHSRRPKRCAYVAKHPWKPWLKKLVWDIWGPDYVLVRNALKDAIERGLEFTASQPK